MSTALVLIVAKTSNHEEGELSWVHWTVEDFARLVVQDKSSQKTIQKGELKRDCWRKEMIQTTMHELTRLPLR